MLIYRSRTVRKHRTRAQPCAEGTATEKSRTLTLEGLLRDMPARYRRDWAQRFWARVDIGDGEENCWLWTGATTDSRYGIVSVNRQLIRAHRLSYLIVHGSIVASKYCLHRCDEPRCVNPRHLTLGNARDNVRDMVQKGRGSNRKLNADIVRAIRAQHAAGVSFRELAIRHSVAASTVFAVTSRRTWRNVEDYVQQVQNAA